MTPEEKFENRTWEILQKIKEEILFSGMLSISWKHSLDPYRSSFSYERGEKAILETLKKKGALKITEEIHMLMNGSEIDTLCLNILQPKFDELYEKYKNSNSINDTEFKQYHLPDKSSENSQELIAIAQNQILQEAENRKIRIEREKLRLQQLNGKNLYIYALEQIIEKVVIEDKNTQISLRLHNEFAFPLSTDSINIAEKFLGELKNYGCFDNFIRPQSRVFVLVKPDIKKLKEYKNKLIKKLDREEIFEKKIVSTKNKIKKGKIEVFISVEKGIYKNKNVNLNYPIQNRSKRFKLIKDLKDGKKDGKILADTLYKGSLSELSKEIKEINKNFENKLKLKNKLIINLETGGYKLNDHNYNIEFIE